MKSWVIGGSCACFENPRFLGGSCVYSWRQLCVFLEGSSVCYEKLGFLEAVGSGSGSLFAAWSGLPSVKHW